MAKPKTGAHDPNSRYEVRDVSLTVVAILASGLAASIAGVLIMVGFAFPAANRPYMRGPTVALPPAPRLESAPFAELDRYEARKAAELTGRGGPQRIPIEQAMRETAKQGWAKP